MSKDQGMTSRKRLLTALEGSRPDRLPVTTHHLMPWFLDRYLDGIGEDDFFRRFGLDPTRWAYDLKPDESRGEYWSEELEPGHRFIVSDRWRMEATLLDGQPGLAETGPTANRSRPASPNAGPTWRYHIHTPGGSLSMVLRRGAQTDWVLERPLKEKAHLEIFRRHAPLGLCDVEAIRRKAETLEDGILRGGVPGFEIYGQPGCWQDGVELFGLQELIMETADDPSWVRELLGVLRERKEAQIVSMEGAPYDLIELGGGSASSTVISPGIFQEFVAPHDEPLIRAAHGVGLKVVYHSCGGMMPLLEMIADMGPDAMETFTPPALGGDTRLAEARERVGERVCMIGGFDQHSFFTGCTPQETREAVRRCFREGGAEGGYILAPSDHFFDAELPLLEAFADEARRCVYEEG